MMAEMTFAEHGAAPLPSDGAEPGREERIVQWLREYIADILRLPVEKIEVDASFQQLGLDSSAAVGMTGDLADWLGVEIDPAAAYDHPSIGALAGMLAA
ncbi:MULTISPECIES: acyl carrier protein [Burkholderia]|uniref:acyl carrier protein n=2 Tax=Burkholderia TaxID=32008 RepID=UPI001CF3E63C|nr:MULTISPECIES: acyl carrier protein [Burkholderia]